MTKHLIRKKEQMRAERDCETKLNLDEESDRNLQRVGDCGFSDLHQLAASTALEQLLGSLAPAMPPILVCYL